MIPLLAALAICQIPGISLPAPTPVGDPFIVTIRNLRTQPIPPNPIRVVAPVLLVDTAVMIGDGNDSIWVVNVPTEPAVGISVGATMDVTGTFNGSAIIATKYAVYFNQSDNVYREIIGRPQPAVPDPVTLYGAKKIPVPATVRGTISFRPVCLEAKVMAEYQDLSGRKYQTELTDRTTWMVYTDTCTLTITQGGKSWVGEFERKLAMD